MPDDKTPEQIAAEAKAAEAAKAPVFDTTKMAKDMADQVVGGIRKMAEEAAANQPAPQPAYDPNQRPDPLTAAVAPIVAPAIQAVGVRAEAATDAAMFYADSDPDTLQFKAKHKGEVEALFNAELKAGRFTPREDILAYLRGGKLLNEVIEGEVSKRKAAEDRAREAETAGPGGVRAFSHKPAKDPYTMTDEELTKSLEGVSF